MYPILAIRKGIHRYLATISMSNPLSSTNILAAKIRNNSSLASVHMRDTNNTQIARNLRMLHGVSVAVDGFA